MQREGYSKLQDLQPLHIIVCLLDFVYYVGFVLMLLPFSITGAIVVAVIYVTVYMLFVFFYDRE